jgi:hypothetical protein
MFMLIPSAPVLVPAGACTFMVDSPSPKSVPIPDRIVRSFWHGEFSAYEALCLSSFVAAGLEVELFSEAAISGLPPGGGLAGRP